MKIYAHTSRFDISKIVGQEIWVKARAFNATTQKWFGGTWWVRVTAFDGKYYRYDMCNRLIEDMVIHKAYYGFIHPTNPINLLTTEELFGGNDEN